MLTGDRILLVWVVLAMSLITGCGSRDETLVDVRGEVTFCGEPAVAEILFEPQRSAGEAGGRASSAMSDEHGKFRLSYDGSKYGAKRGKHRVTIRVLRLPGQSDSEKGSSGSGTTIGALQTVHLAREVSDSSKSFRFLLTY